MSFDFLNYERISPVRRDLLQSGAMDAARAFSGAPYLTYQENVVTQDQATGTLTAGTVEYRLGYDGNLTEGAFVPGIVPTETARLEAAKERFVALTLARRDVAVCEGAPTSHGVMDATSESRSLITAAVSMANLANMASQPFSLSITLKDRSTVTLDGAAMVQFGVEVGSFVAGIYAEAGALESELRAATTVAQVLTIAGREGLYEQPRDPVTGQFISYEDAANG